MPRTAQQCEAMRDEMKQRILTESLRYFARNGFAGTRIGDLSKNIGIAQGTIYRYFDSKEDLFREIRVLISNEADVKQLGMLAKLPLPAKTKIRRLTQDILGRLERDELFAASVALNTQMLLEQQEARVDPAAYRSELYVLTARIVEQGQREGSVVEGNALKLADFYWGVAYLCALKRLFAPGLDMIDASDMERTLLKQGR